jgi:hypothetical protein
MPRNGYGLITPTGPTSFSRFARKPLPGNGALKWSGKFRQRAKIYPALTTGYRNDDETQFFGQI